MGDVENDALEHLQRACRLVKELGDSRSELRRSLSAARKELEDLAAELKEERSMRQALEKKVEILQSKESPRIVAEVSKDPDAPLTPTNVRIAHASSLSPPISVSFDPTVRSRVFCEDTLDMDGNHIGKRGVDCGVGGLRGEDESTIGETPPDSFGEFREGDEVVPPSPPGKVFLKGVAKDDGAAGARTRSRAPVGEGWISVKAPGLRDSFSWSPDSQNEERKHSNASPEQTLSVPSPMQQRTLEEYSKGRTVRDAAHLARETATTPEGYWKDTVDTPVREARSPHKLEVRRDRRKRRRA